MNELKKVRRAYCVAMRKFQKHQEIDYVLPNNGTIINTSQVKDLQEAERLVTLHIRAVSDMETKYGELKTHDVRHQTSAQTSARVMRQLLDDLRQHLTNIQPVYQTWATLSQDVQEKEIAWKAWQSSEPLFVTSVEIILADFQTRTEAYQYASKEQSTTTSTPLLLVAKESKQAENIDDLPVTALLSVASTTTSMSPTRSTPAKAAIQLDAPVRIDVDFTAENDGDSVVPAIDLDRVLRIDLTLPEESLVGFNAWGPTRVKYRTLHNLSVYFYDQEEEGWKQKEKEHEKKIQELENELEEKIKELNSFTSVKIETLEKETKLKLLYPGSVKKIEAEIMALTVKIETLEKETKLKLSLKPMRTKRRILINNEHADNMTKLEKEITAKKKEIKALTKTFEALNSKSLPKGEGALYGQGELLAREAVENGRKELALAKSDVEKGRQQGRLTVQCDNKDTSSPPQYYVETDKTVRNFLEDGTKLPLGKTFKMQLRLSFGVVEYGATKMMIVRGQRSFLREASRRLGDQLPVGRELFR